VRCPARSWTGGASACAGSFSLGDGVSRLSGERLPDDGGLLGRRPAFEALSKEISDATEVITPEYLAVATWLAATHHRTDPAQQKRVITGHVVRRAQQVTEGGWRDRYRDTRHLSDTVQAILDKYLPLGG
jgi:hypothetical protein